MPVAFKDEAPRDNHRPSFRAALAARRLRWTAPNDPSTIKKNDWIIQDNTYDAAGQLVQSVKTRRYCGQKTKLSTTTNTWDLAGNLVLSSTQTGKAKPDLVGYQYDEAGRLTAYGENLTQELAGRSVKAAASQYKTALKRAVTFTYDALGRVVGQDLKSEHVTWAHDGLDPVYAVDGKTPEIYLRDAYGELLGQQVGGKGTPEWYVQDALRSILGTVEKGKIQSKDTDYTDYGVQLKDLKLRFGYSGEQTDPKDNQRVHYYARSYQPTLATWLEADPRAGNIVDPRSLQRRVFAFDDPVSLRDSLGMEPQPFDYYDFDDTPCGPFGGSGFVLDWSYMHCAVELDIIINQLHQTPTKGVNWEVRAPEAGPRNGPGRIDVTDGLFGNNMWEIKRANDKTVPDALDQLTRYQKSTGRNPGYALFERTIIVRTPTGLWEVSYWSHLDENKVADGVVQYIEKPIPPFMVPAPAPEPTPEPKQPIRLPEPFRGHSVGVVIGVVAIAVVVTVVFKAPGWQLIPALL